MNLYQKPSGIWAVDFVNAEGKRERVSTGCRNHADAKRRAREIIAGIGRPEPVSTPKPASAQAQGTTVKDLFAMCLKAGGPWAPGKVRRMANVLSMQRQLEPHIGDVLLTDVTTALLEALKETLLEKSKPGTVRRKMDCLGVALKFAARQGLILQRPDMPSIKVDNFKSRILEAHEEEAAFAAIDRRIKAEPQRPWQRFRHLLRWLLDTGCRLGEPLQATTDWIKAHGSDPVLEIPDGVTKNGKGRPVPLSDDVVATLPFLRINAVDGRLFPMSHATAWYMWTNIRDDVKKESKGKIVIDDVTLHTMRHTALTRLMRGGLDIHLVSKWAGHSDISITMRRYTKIDAGDLMAGKAALQAVKSVTRTHLKAV